MAEGMTTDEKLIAVKAFDAGKVEGLRMAEGIARTIHDGYRSCPSADQLLVVQAIRAEREKVEKENS